ncbi:MAG TPA: DUF1015 domain-containing protein [Brumimicrobium sp.]|nr:DUF1015 domain-containing protein [Brumimicrobium sp.]
MTKIKAFKAIRPVRSKAHLVASRAVATYKDSLLQAKLESNPYTFIHIIHPDYLEDENRETNHNSEEHFNKVRTKYKEFREKNILLQDKEESIYIYRQSNPLHSYLGVITGVSLQDYFDNKIKKHEATLAPREEMFTNYLDVVGFNAEPVLLSHRKSEELDEILAQLVQKRPEYEFTTSDKITHEVWLANPQEVESIVKAYEKIECCYIADGHHRTASSARLLEKIKNRPEYSPDKNYNYFLGFLIDENRLNIMPFNRLCKSLNGHTKENILSALETYFEVTQLDNPSEPEQLHDIHMYLENSWYRLRLKMDKHTKSDAVSSIDAEILTRYILTPILGIHDLTRDNNISFVNSETPVQDIEQSVNKGVYKIGFSLYPVTMEQLKAVADENAIMPPKSTWIEPKMRSGLTILKLNE